ncbi:hypothetical protein P7C73_g1322, partial [Tremellales sp. Uapishka_1]
MTIDPATTVTLAGQQVPPMAIGTWSWGDSLWNHKEEDFPLIKEAWDASNKAGLTFYDTAEVYGEGESERIIGRLIKETDDETKRNLYIATKFLPIPRPANWFLFRPNVVERLKLSLERMGLDSVPLYQLHSASGLHSFETLGRQLAECYKLGLAKAIGVSNFSVKELIKMSEILERHGAKLSSNQIEFSLLRQIPAQSGLLQYMKDHDIACLAYSPLAMGRLTGKYNASNPIPKGRRFSSGFTWEQLEPLIEAMRPLAKKYDVSISAIALNWVICNGAIPLGGARNASQAEQNAMATKFRLTDEEVRALSAKGFPGTNNIFWQHG